MGCTATTNLARAISEGLHLLQSASPKQHLAKHHVSAIQPGGWTQTEKELRRISVFASIGHAHCTETIVFEDKALIVKESTAINAFEKIERLNLAAIRKLIYICLRTFSTRSVEMSIISSLNHEIGNNPMKFTFQIMQMPGVALKAIT